MISLKELARQKFIKNKINLKHILFLTIILLLSLPISTADASSSAQNITQDVAQSYYAINNIKAGTIVGLTSRRSNIVSPIATKLSSRLLGVVVSASNTTATLTPSSSKPFTNAKLVYVSTLGSYNVLVSNQNGPISPGQYITISSSNGIGMRADQSEPVVLGTALTGFNGAKGSLYHLIIKSSTGYIRTVNVGRILVNISIKQNPLQTPQSSYVPSFLNKIAFTAAQKQVSPFKVYLSILILLASIIITVVILYSGVKNGMKAIGRNPLSKKSIIAGLIQTIIAGLIIFIVGLFTVYFILKL